MKKAVLHFLFLHQFSTCVFALPYLPYLTLRVICLKAMRAAYLRGSCFSPFAFYLCLSAKNAQIILVFFCGWFSSVSYASPPLANDVHFCQVLDYEAMRARDSLYAATKQALNLNVGEPRTVRMIYFLPNDRLFQQAVVDSMKVTIRQIQTFFADQMEAHGYGRKTFRFETDAQGDPVVHRVDGRHPDSHYLKNPRAVGDELLPFDNYNVYLIVVDNSIWGLNRVGGDTVAGWAFGGRNSGEAWVSETFTGSLAAHELGHAFGLQHDFRDNTYIMSYGAGQRRSISACAAEYLSVHPYFDPDIPDEKTPGPKIELISPNEYPTGSTSVSIQLKVSDSDGIHQIILYVYPVGGIGSTTREVKTCHGLDGETNAIVEFDYDGVIPSNENTSLSNPVVHKFQVEAVDTEGNVGEVSFSLQDISTSHNLITTLEGPTNSGYFAIPSVAFSPDGTIIVAGSRRGTIKLWDVVTQTSISTFEAVPWPLWDVAFSPDGTILAVGGGGMVKLWDVAKRTNILTLDTHTRHVYSVAFSPDNVSLAVGTLEGVQVWDVAASTPYLLFTNGSDRIKRQYCHN